LVGAVRDTLPLASGIALNPLAIVGSILMICQPNSRENNVAFVSGWVLGLALLLILATWIIQDLVSVLSRRHASYLPSSGLDSGAVPVLRRVYAAQSVAGR
jgi:hypothetical protein